MGYVIILLITYFHGNISVNNPFYNVASYYTQDKVNKFKSHNELSAIISEYPV